MRQIGWYALQLSVVGLVFWGASTPEGLANGGANPYAVTIGAVLMAAAATAAVMIARDSFLVVVRWLARIRGLPGKPNDTSERGRSLSATARGSRQPPKLAPRVRIGKQPR